MFVKKRWLETLRRQFCAGIAWRQCTKFCHFGRLPLFSVRSSHLHRHSTVASISFSGSETEASDEVGNSREDPEIGRQERKQTKQDLLGKGKVEELRGIGQGRRGGGRGFERGVRGLERGARGALRGGGTWGRGLGGHNLAQRETPRKTIHVKQTLI